MPIPYGHTDLVNAGMAGTLPPLSTPSTLLRECPVRFHVSPMWDPKTELEHEPEISSVALDTSNIVLASIREGFGSSPQQAFEIGRPGDESVNAERSC